MRTLCVSVALVALAGCGSSASTSTQSTAKGASQHTTNAGPSVKVGVKPKFVKASGPVRSGTIDIAYRDIAIEPDTVRAKVGSTIVWTNYDATAHNVTSVGGTQRIASGDFNEGQTFSLKLTKPGVIHYISTQQPASMNGTIEVTG